MQRGILTLTKNQILVAFDLTKSSNKNLIQLSNKLQMAIDEVKEEDVIEVNENEVESLLDVLPIPTVGERENYKELRNKLLLFLARKDG